VDALLIAVSAREPQRAYLAALFAIVGSVAGSLALFAIARKGGEVFLARYIERGTGKWLHAWFTRYGLATVFIPAVSPFPLPMKIPVFCAGALEVGWAPFTGVLVAARTIRYIALAYLAQRYGSATLSFLKMHWGAVLAAALSLAVATILVLRLAQKDAAIARGIR
jgi:membrane protein YqaA with SNARE-associated domain